MRALFLLSLLAVMIPAPAEEQVYKWQGGEATHYSDQPPPHQEAEKVNLDKQSVSVIGTEGIYKWMDADGKVHYSPKQPAGVQDGEWVDRRDLPGTAVIEAEETPAPAAPEQPAAAQTGQEAPAAVGSAPGAEQETAQEAPLPGTTPQEQKIYTWRDTQGRMHVSTQPPPGQESKD